MTPSNDRKFVECGEPHYTITNPYEIHMNVKIDTFANALNQIQPIMLGIVEAVKTHVHEKHAEKIFQDLQPHIAEVIKQKVTELVEKRIIEMVSKIDLETLGKLATIGAAKELGKVVAQ